MNDRELASSPCMMHDADPAYQGYLSQEETIAVLLELLHAERAGARVCAQSQRQAPSEAHKVLLQDIHRDDNKSCKGLLASLAALNAAADEKVGDFAAKCLAITDFEERLACLNRGQRWVVRKIEDTVARVHNADIQQQLLIMLQDHRQNVSKIDTLLHRME